MKDLGGLRVLLNAIGLHVVDELINHPERFWRRVDLLPGRALVLSPRASGWASLRLALASSGGAAGGGLIVPALRAAASR